MTYRRYHIETKKALHLIKIPSRFKVKVNRLALAKLLIQEAIEYKGKLPVIMSRPCVYGVFSGPIGGFAPREELCVGCLRCTTQYPEVVKILHNPERNAWGDHFFKKEYVETILYEAETGKIPIKGAGYRGKFGGANWDGMWTDMSEIVRPTRDGIHGREYISTEVDIGKKYSYVTLDEKQKPKQSIEKVSTIPCPIILDTPPHFNCQNKNLCQTLIESAKQLQLFTVLPMQVIQQFAFKEQVVIPLISDLDWKIEYEPLFFEMAGWDEKIYNYLCTHFPNSQPILRVSFETDLTLAFQAGVRLFHLTANYHGENEKKEFILDLIQKANQLFIQQMCREEVFIIGSGGIIAAEHLPKAILCGLDAVALDTAIMVALQAQFQSSCTDYSTSQFKLPHSLPVAWATQRIKNLIGAWRDQLLEVLGAMGMRDVRRMRGELGRAMFQKNLEKEAFKEITNYES